MGRVTQRPSLQGARRWPCLNSALTLAEDAQCVPRTEGQTGFKGTTVSPCDAARAASGRWWVLGRAGPAPAEGPRILHGNSPLLRGWGDPTEASASSASSCTWQGTTQSSLPLTLALSSELWPPSPAVSKRKRPGVKPPC